MRCIDLEFSIELRRNVQYTSRQLLSSRKNSIVEIQIQKPLASTLVGAKIIREKKFIQGAPEE